MFLKECDSKTNNVSLVATQKKKNVKKKLKFQNRKTVSVKLKWQALLHLQKPKL
jgi:hypothetical protein